MTDAQKILTIEDFVEFAVRRLGIEKAPELKFASNRDWAVERHSFGQYDHGHGDAIVAGTYYFQTNGEDGNISFGNPSPIVFTGGTPFGHLSHEVEPKVGRLLLFPGWLIHKVKINNTDSTRISLSFNFHLTSK